MSWLSNKSLASKVRNNASHDTLVSFEGIFSIDKLPQFISHRPFLAIVNTHTHNLPGEHWLAIYIDGDKRGEIFDPLSLPISNILIQWMNRFTIKWKTNNRAFQDLLSSSCGAFVLYFVLNRRHVDSFESITSSFTSYPSVNEEFVKKFYDSLL